MTSAARAQWLWRAAAYPSTDDRRWHRRITPRGNGLAICGAFLDVRATTARTAALVPEAERCPGCAEGWPT